MSRITVVSAGGVTRIGFDRPDKRNALDAEMVGDLHRALDTIVEPSILIMHSTTPGMFVSGADIAELRERTGADALQRINGALFDRIAEYRWPTIAVVDGPALGGGCELSLACDFRIATSRAVFAQPELSLGIMAAAGGNYRLERLVGLGLARRILFKGETLQAYEALACGLVDAAVDPADLDGEVEAFVKGIFRASWQALEMTKRALAVNAPDTSAFDATAQAVLFESDEKYGRMDEFLAKREERRISR